MANNLSSEVVLSPDAAMAAGSATPSAGRFSLPALWAVSVARDLRHEKALDLAGGTEFSPSVSNADRDLTVLFDGVLYNRAELIAQLGGSRARLNDADVVKLAYERWGMDVPHRVKGLFAFVIADPAQSRCLAVRDPLGAYPLFMTQTADRLVLSTSIDMIRRQPGVNGSLNRVALADHLYHRWPDPQETFFTSIRRVPAGYMAVSVGGTTTVTRYWEPVPTGRAVDWVTADELREEFEARFERAVDRALALGRPGIYLSGGLDSISVAAMAADICRRDDRPLPIALSLGFPDDSDEEFEQRGVAKSLGLRQEFVRFDEAVPYATLLTAALEISKTRPAPMLNPWTPAYAELTRRGKRDGVEVILSGAGGDEWMGVTPLVAADLIRGGHFGDLGRLIAGWSRSCNMSRLDAAKTLGVTFGLRPLVSSALSHLAPEAWNASRLKRSLKRQLAWVAPDAGLQAELNDRVRRWLRPATPAQSYYLTDVRTTLEHPLTAMELEEMFETGRWLGVRYLHPFWAAEVADILYRTPPLLLFQGGRSKSIVRETMARRFPSLGLDRQKKRAGTAYYKIVLHREIPNLWKTHHDLAATADLGIVDARAVAALADTSIRADEGPGLGRLWDVMNVEAWIRAHQ